MELSTGPLEVLLCWQTIVFAFVVVAATHGVKAVIDAIRESKAPGTPRGIILQRVVLPAVPLVVGALLAPVLPMYPDVLHDYIATHAFTGFNKVAVLAAYGLCVGQFSAYLWDRYSGLMTLKKPPEAP